MRRIVDIHFHRSFLQLCLNRGTITIHSSNDELPSLQLTTFNTKQLYQDLKQVWYGIGSSAVQAITILLWSK